MALMLPHSVFFHIPKTGGTWVRHAIQNAGIPATELKTGSNLQGDAHSQRRDVETAGKFTFAFVRHPLNWYASFWNHRMMTGWKFQDRIDRYMSLDFEAFVWNVIRHDPGHLAKRYESYLGRAPGVLGFIGRTEDLASGLVKALRLAGETFNEEKLLGTPRENVSLIRPVYSSRTRGALLEAERETLERFGYS